MGFTVGAGGSGIIAEGAVTTDKIADGAVSPEKLDGTGTPGATTYYRGDGAWETPAGADSAASSHSRYGDATKGSTNTNIVKFGTAIGTPDSSVISHNDADFATQGSIFTILEDGTYMINVSTSSAAAGFGVYILYGTTVDNNLQTIIGGETQPLNGTLCSFVNSRKVNFVAGDKVWVYCTNALTDFGAYNYLHSISIIKLTKGEKGDTGATGAGAITPTSVWYTGIAARGSTNTLVPRWSTNTQTVGTGITYSASASLGDCFQVTETGQYIILTGFYATTAFEALLHIGDAIVNTIDFNAASVVDFSLINTNQYLNGPSFEGQIAAGKKIWVTTGAAPYNVYPIKNRIQIIRVG